MKKNKEWIKELDAETTKKFFYALNNYREDETGYLDKKSEDFYAAINTAFTWHGTPEGLKFWHNVASKTGEEK